jgi:MerR family mercuric resistance operon transcriptional regulator
MVVQIGGLSEATGVHIETIRYYEKAGLLPPPPRSPGGRRQYDSHHVARLASIKRCRELGFTLEETKTLLGLADGNYTCGEVREITLRHQQSIKEKITDLKRLEKSLGGLAASCEGGDTKVCPVIDTLFNRRTQRQR